MKRSGSTLLSSAKPRRSRRQRGVGVQVGIDAGLAARCRQECMPSEGTTHAASSSTYREPANLLLLIVSRLAASFGWRHSWQHAIESHATNGGFIPGGRRSRVLSHSHSGTLDIRPAVRCGRERRRKIVIAARAAEGPFQRVKAVGRPGAGPAFCGYPP